MMPYGMQYGQNGWSRLGASMGGAMSGQSQQMIYDRAAVMGMQQGNLLQLARKNRDQNLAREAVTPEVVQRAATGDPAAQALVTSAAMQMGANPEQFSQAQHTQQGMNYQGATEAMAAGPNPDLNAINARNMAMNGKVVPLSAVQGGVALDPLQTPNVQTMAPTQVGLADIMQKGAEAGAANARATDSYANASRARAGIGADKAANYEIVPDGNGNLIRINKMNPADVQPVTMGGKPVTGAVKGGGGNTAPTAADYQAIGATNPMTGKVDPIKAQIFMAWKEQQGIKSTPEALQKFAAMKRAPVGTPGAAPPIIDSPIPVPSALGSAMAGQAPAPVSAPQGAAAAMGGGVPPAAPAAPAKAAPRSTIAGVARAANGAYTPQSKADYDKLPAGAQYVRPGESVVRVKGSS